METFAESSDGIVLSCNGIDPCVRWDGFATSMTEAGVAPPATAPALAGSGSGTITGTYFAYVRYVDKFGNVSDLSPVSSAATFNMVGQVNYSSLPVPQQSTVVRRQILRNSSGSLGGNDASTVFYVDIDTTDLGSTSLSSTRIDADLVTQEQVSFFDTAGNDIVNVHGQPPNTAAFLCFHQDRMYYAGIQSYLEGSCAVTTGSTTVAGYGTEWKTTFAGRLFYTPNGGQPYEIVSCNPVAQTLTLTTPYLGATDTRAQYAVRPQPGFRKTFFWSEPDLPESVPASNALTLPEDGDDITGLINYGSYLYFLENRHMYRLTVRQDPAADGRVFLACNLGALSARTCVVIEESLYLMGRNGVYRYRGDDQGELLSTPIQDYFLDDDAPGTKINWGASRYFHACHSPQEEVIRFYVALAGDYVPRHILVFEYKDGKWWTEDAPRRQGASVLGRIGGSVGTYAQSSDQPFVGSHAAGVLAPGRADLDGNPVGGTFRGRATGAGWLSLTDASAQFGADVDNCPVAIAQGKGRGQVRTIVAHTTTRLSLNLPWRNKPDETSVYVIGGIAWTYSSQRLRWSPGESQQARSTEIEFVPTTVKNLARVSLAPDFSDPLKVAWPIDKGIRQDVVAAVGEFGQDVDLTNIAGHTLLQQKSYREGTTDGSEGRVTRLVMSGVAGEESVRIGVVVVAGASG